MAIKINSSERALLLYFHTKHPILKYNHPFTLLLNFELEVSTGTELL